jgi:adenosylcobyric acid synthase
LPLRTTLTSEKKLTQSQGEICIDDGSAAVKGYEIHVGKTVFTQSVKPLVTLDNGQADGCVNDENNIAGTYLHGLFENDAVIGLLADWVGLAVGEQQSYEKQQHEAIDRLADSMSEHLDMNKIKSFLLGAKHG